MHRLGTSRAYTCKRQQRHACMHQQTTSLSREMWTQWWACWESCRQEMGMCGRADMQSTPLSTQVIDAECRCSTCAARDDMQAVATQHSNGAPPRLWQMVQGPIGRIQTGATSIQPLQKARTASAAGCHTHYKTSHHYHSAAATCPRQTTACRLRWYDVINPPLHWCSLLHGRECASNHQAVLAP